MIGCKGIKVCTVFNAKFSSCKQTLFGSTNMAYTV